jgi:murein L,D-transpeptidase YafK
VAATTLPAQAFRIELKDVAPDRIERQRAEAIGQIPFPDTPNIAQFDQRLKDKGLAAGAAMFIRVFKAESELEVWMQKGDRFELFATYPICHWSGTLGPKVSEGDKQSPEGVYTVSSKQLHMVGRHPRSLNLGFPNVLDRQFQRTGSYILIHGGCGSVGCFAMTNPVIEEIFSLSQAALKGGQEALHVHVFPFRMTEQKLRAYALHEWYDFWRNLKDIHDSFEKTRRVPKVTVCEGRYWVDGDEGNGEVASQGPLAVCGAPLAASLSNPTVSAPWPTVSNSNPLLKDQRARFRESASSRLPAARPAAGLLPSSLNPQPSPASVATTTIRPVCQTGLASCRKWIAQQTARLRQRAVVAQVSRAVPQRR